MEVLKGAFVESLQRSNKDIKNDRASSISEDAEMVYRRMIEDMEMDLKRMRRERENMLDLSPSNKMMIIQAGEFDAKGFADRDLELGVKMKILKEKIDIAKERSFYLFGDNSGVTSAPATETAVPA